MNMSKAVGVRDACNELECVETPHEDSPSNCAYRLARVHQTGYTNGEPHFEVLLTPNRRDQSVHITRELVGMLADRKYYARVDMDDGEIHIRSGLLAEEETGGGE